MRWKKIAGYGNLYEVSDYGDIRNRKTKRLRKLTPKNHGYIGVTVKYDGKWDSIAVHRAVAIAFIPNPENKPQVNHKWGNKLDNYYKHLEWATQSENCLHSYHILGNVTSANIGGAMNIHSKLNQEQQDYVLKNHKPHDKEFGITALGRKYNVHRKTIENIIRLSKNAPVAQGIERGTSNA